MFILAGRKGLVRKYQRAGTQDTVEADRSFDACFRRGPHVSRDPVRVMIVDDHPVFRDGLRQCLEARKEIRVVAAIGGGEEVWEAIRAHGLDFEVNVSPVA